MGQDVFPSATTRVRELLRTGAQSRAELLHYLMSVYHRPLSIYFLATSYRSLGEPDDIVHGYFVSYLARPGYLEKWISTEKRLRHWLANGMLFYCRDCLNDRRRHRGEPVEHAEPAAPPPEAIERYDREVRVQMTRAALEQAAEDCRRRGMEEHWRLFEAYHLREVPLESAAAEAGVDRDRAWVMVRTAQRAFTKALREIIGADIDSDDSNRIDAAIAEM